MRRSRLAGCPRRSIRRLTHAAGGDHTALRPQQALGDNLVNQSDLQFGLYDATRKESKSGIDVVVFSAGGERAKQVNKLKTFWHRPPGGGLPQEVDCTPTDALS